MQSTSVLQPKKLLAEALGTAVLVFFGAGVATLTFGFHLAGSSTAAGVVSTALAFGLVLLVLAYALGPLSGCHVNPAVTLGFVVARRMAIRDALGYWVAQIVGGIGGALLLWAVVASADGYHRSTTGLGADGFGSASTIGLDATGAVIAEIVLTALFVFVVLSATRNTAAPQVSGVVIGLALTVVHLVGIPLTGTSVNPARSIGPALVVGGLALSQLWVFIVAPLVGGGLAALAHNAFYASEQEEVVRLDVADAVPEREDAFDLRDGPATGRAGADGGRRGPRQTPQR
jgi:aquaporin Z